MEDHIRKQVTDLFSNRTKGQDEKPLMEFDAIFQEINPDKQYKFILDSIEIFVELMESSTFSDFSDTENNSFGDVVWNKRNDAIRDIQSDFNRLSYPEKLIYWKENISTNIDEYICDDDLTFISVLPQNNEQKELHDKWVIENITEEQKISSEKLEDDCLKHILEMCPDGIKPIDEVIEYIKHEISTYSINDDTSEEMPEVFTFPNPKLGEIIVSPAGKEQFYVTARVRRIYVNFLKICKAKLENYDITGDISIIDSLWKENTDTITPNYKTPKRSKFNTTSLSHKQTLLLMYYLRNRSIVLNTCNNTVLADCFSVLTGFSQNTLRQEMNDDSSEISDRAQDFEKLISVLSELVDNIITDKNDFQNQRKIE